MENKIIYNFLNKDEINSIYEAVNKKNKSIEIQDFLGRTRLDYEKADIHLIGESILQKVSYEGRKINQDYILSYFSFVEYNNKFGIPRLGPHKDTSAYKLSFLYQIESNIDWEIYVDGIPYLLEDNSALIVNVRDQDHWRPTKEFKDDQFLKMVFFHFLDPNDEEMNYSTPEQLHEVNMKWSHITGYTEDQRTYSQTNDV